METINVGGHISYRPWKSKALKTLNLGDDGLYRPHTFAATNLMDHRYWLQTI